MGLLIYSLTTLIDVAGLLVALCLIKIHGTYRSHFYLFLYFVLSCISDIVAGHTIILPAPSFHKLAISIVLLVWLVGDRFKKGKVA